MSESNGLLGHSARNAWIAFGRVFIGLFWLYEITIGHNNKIFNPQWVGGEAGTWLINDLQTAFGYGTWGWFQTLAETTMLPHAAMMSYFVTALQVVLAISFILGILTLPIAIIGLCHISIMFLTGHSRIPPFFAFGHMFIIASCAGMYFGIDGILLEKYRDAKSGSGKILSQLITLEFIRKPIVFKALMVILAVVGIYSLLHIPVMGAPQLRMSSLGLTYLTALGLAYLYLRNKQIDNIKLIARGVQIFVGFKFLHEIWVRTPVALNGIPGWSTSAQLNEVLNFIAERHWGIMSGVVNSLFIPASGRWVAVFGLVQFAVGLALIFGFKTKFDSRAGLIYLGLLILLGFTRYTPFVFGFLALGYGLENGVRLPRFTIGFAGAAFVALAIIAAVGGMKIGDYRENMGSVVAAMFAMFALMTAFTAFAQGKPQSQKTPESVNANATSVLQR